MYLTIPKKIYTRNVKKSQDFLEPRNNNQKQVCCHNKNLAGFRGDSAMRSLICFI